HTTTNAHHTRSLPTLFRSRRRLEVEVPPPQLEQLPPPKPGADRGSEEQAPGARGRGEERLGLLKVEEGGVLPGVGLEGDPRDLVDRKSTRLNSSHVKNSYA